MEEICFPPNEECSKEMMIERIAKAPKKINCIHSKVPVLAVCRHCRWRILLKL